MNEFFGRFARAVEKAVGSPWAFVAAFASVVAWVACGPLFGWTDTYQLVANTFTTLITYLLIFLLQSSQNRNSAILEAKINELIRASDKARNEIILADEMPDEEVDRIRRELKDAAYRSG
jgi:low affinity Fe/Cu permease